MAFTGETRGRGKAEKAEKAERDERDERAFAALQQCSRPALERRKPAAGCRGSGEKANEGAGKKLGRAHLALRRDGRGCCGCCERSKGAYERCGRELHP